MRVWAAKQFSRRRGRLPRGRTVVIALVVATAAFASIASSRSELKGETFFVATFDQLRRANAEAELRVCAEIEAHDLVLAGRVAATRFDLKAFDLPFTLSDSTGEIARGAIGLEENVLLRIKWADFEHRLPDLVAEDAFCTEWLALSMGPLTGDSAGTARWTVTASAVPARGPASMNRLSIEFRTNDEDRR
jgi:hypothetical protein